MINSNGILKYTLKTFEKSLSKNFEIVIVDDYSAAHYKRKTNKI